MINSDTESEVENYFVYIAFMVCACLGMILSHICDNRLNDAMFLCPMSREERKQYVKCGYWTKVGMIFIPYLVLLFILCALGYLDVMSLLVLAVIMLIYLLGINSYLSGKREGRQLWFTFSGYCEFMIFYIIFENGGLSSPTWDIGVWICIAILGLVLLFYFGQLFWKTRVEYVKMVMECMDYENSN